jgi:2-methylcitrate dehydratase PrpD
VTVVAAKGTIAQRLARWATGLRYEDLPDAVVRKTAELVGYELALALRGHGTELADQACALARTLSPGGGPCTVIGTDIRAQPLDAAFANCSLMRAWEIDDVLFPVGVHAGLVVQPPALALAERDGRSGKDLIVAVVAGYCAIAKLATGTFAWGARQPRRPTIPYGPFGGAVACGLLLGLDAERLTSAIGYAAHSAMGLSADAVWQHYYGLVARNGLTAALLAQAGGRTEAEVLEAKFGFYDTFFGVTPDGVMDATGPAGAEILGTTTKRYPGTGLNIVSVELAREMVVRDGLTAGDVARIEITYPTERRNFDGDGLFGPYADWRACSAAPFQMAMVIVDRGVTDWARYHQPDSAEILAIVRKMTVRYADGLPERYARIEVTTVDGRRLIREGTSYEFPPVDVREQILAAGERLLPRTKLHEAAEMAAALPDLRDVGLLMRSLAA